MPGKIESVSRRSRTALFVSYNMNVIADVDSIMGMDF